MHMYRKSGITSGLKTQINLSVTKKMDILAFQKKEEFQPPLPAEFSKCSLTAVFFSQF